MSKEAHHSDDMYSVKNIASELVRKGYASSEAVVRKVEGVGKKDDISMSKIEDILKTFNVPRSELGEYMRSAEPGMPVQRSAQHESFTSRLSQENSQSAPQSPSSRSR